VQELDPPHARHRGGAFLCKDQQGRGTGLSRNTFLLAFASLFADISTEMLYPVLPIFLTQTPNLSLWENENIED
jgi:hypothetical protein